MTKKEIIWREILHSAVNHKAREFTQKQVAERFGVSLSTVFHALRELRQLGIVHVTGRNFSVEDPEKFLSLWATHHAFRRAIQYTTHSDLSVREIEGLLPSSAILACYSAFRAMYGTIPADYDKVYVYADADGLQEIRRRFPSSKGYGNVTVLKSDPFLASYGLVTPPVQTYADIWNLEDWYAKDFLQRLHAAILP